MKIDWMNKRKNHYFDLFVFISENRSFLCFFANNPNNAENKVNKK